MKLKVRHLLVERAQNLKGLHSELKSGLFLKSDYLKWIVLSLQSRVSLIFFKWQNSKCNVVMDTPCEAYTK